jgi:hypothetical protein
MMSADRCHWKFLLCGCGASGWVSEPTDLAVQYRRYPCMGCGGELVVDWWEEVLLHGDPCAPEPQGVIEAKG